MILFELGLNCCGIVRGVNTDEVTKERLHSFGFIDGVEVMAVRDTPLGCPRVYRVLNTFIAIRNDIAKKIEIKVKKCLG